MTQYVVVVHSQENSVGFHFIDPDGRRESHARYTVLPPSPDPRRLNQPVLAYTVDSLEAAQDLANLIASQFPRYQVIYAASVGSVTGIVTETHLHKGKFTPRGFLPE
jgi:hypothetical protein